MPTGIPKPVSPLLLAKFGHSAATIRAALKERDWKLADFGRALGYTSNPAASVSTWTSGKGAPGDKLRPKVAALLGVSEEDLMPRDQPADLPPPRSDRELSVNRGRPPSGKKALVFEINTDGTAKIALDLLTSQAKAMKILDMLLKEGIDPAADAAEDDQ